MCWRGNLYDAILRYESWRGSTVIAMDGVELYVAKSPSGSKSPSSIIAHPAAHSYIPI